MLEIIGWTILTLVSMQIVVVVVGSWRMIVVVSLFAAIVMVSELRLMLR